VLPPPIAHHMANVSRASGQAEEPMRDREHLAQADLFIAECTKRMVHQRDVIARAFQKGLATDVPVSMLRALEASLRAFERHRLLIVDRQKE
jgi:putative NADH-flavin reductase